MAKELTLHEHLSNAGKARWANRSAAERAEHGRMMREKRRENEKINKKI